MHSCFIIIMSCVDFNVDAVLLFMLSDQHVNLTTHLVQNDFCFFLLNCYDYGRSGSYSVMNINKDRLTHTSHCLCDLCPCRHPVTL